MKKLVIGTIALTLCFTLTACGNSANNAAITNLGNQLDETSNTICNVQTVNPSDLSISKSMLENVASSNLDLTYNNAMRTQHNLLNEEFYKSEILNRTAQIKNNLNKNIKLSKSQINAVKELTSNLSKYSNSVAYTTKEMNNATKSIASMKKNMSKNYDKINAKLNRLACNSNARSAYYENILSTLNQICNSICLNIEEEQNTPNQPNNTPQQINTTEKTETVKDNKAIKNIDTYLPEIDNKTCENCDKNKIISQDNTYTNQNQYNQNIAPYGNVYNRFGRFNASRNTDTYGPTLRNIDTYGGNYAGFGNYGNGNFGMNGYPYGEFGMRNPYFNNMAYNYRTPYNNFNSNNMNRAPFLEQNIPVNTQDIEQSKNTPEQRLEDFETVNEEDNTIEKVENSFENNEEKNIEEISKPRIIDVRKKAIEPVSAEITNQEELDQEIVAH